MPEEPFDTQEELTPVDNEIEIIKRLSGSIQEVITNFKKALEHLSIFTGTQRTNFLNALYKEVKSLPDLAHDIITALRNLH
jgi:hypothetical protein